MLEIGSIVDGKYKILNKIGQGGMSVVYLATNERANKQWAIKEVRKDGTKDYEVVKQGLIAETDLLKKLNAIIHPAVKRYIRRAIQMEQEAGTEIFVVEAALLIEDKYDEICDELWYIYADENVRMHRLMKNRGYSVEKIRGILANQLSEEEFESHCDFEIDNSGDFQDTVRQIEQRMRMYESM